MRVDVTPVAPAIGSVFDIQPTSDHTQGNSMKKQIALVLAGTAAAIAGGLRLVQDLVDRGESGHAAPTSSTEPSTAGSTPANGTGATANESTGSDSSGRPEPVKVPAGASKAELYEIATELEISGRSKMSKPELIEAINRAG